MSIVDGMASLHAERDEREALARRAGLPPHTLRPMGAGDRGYVIDSWLKTYRPHWLRAYGGQHPQRQLESVYWSRFGHVGLVESLLDDAPGAAVGVLGLPEGGPWMYGWICASDGPHHRAHGARLHYVFVRDEFRGQGLGRRLLELAGLLHLDPLTVTHMTPEFSQRLGRRRDVRFVNPYRKADR